MEEITKKISELNVLSFRSVDDVTKLKNHFKNVYFHPETQKNQKIANYVKKLNGNLISNLKQPRDNIEVEYIFTTAKRNNLQRQRFNSLPVSDVPELLKTEFPNEQAHQVHICTDCNVEIEIFDDVPLIECLQRHFDLEVHQPKRRSDSIDVSEPFELPRMSRRMSALEASETTNNTDKKEKVDKKLYAKLEAALRKVFPNNFNEVLDSAFEFYKTTHESLTRQIATIDFLPLYSTVAPIIMSIKDNVNQNFASEQKTNEDEGEAKKKQIKKKKQRPYVAIETSMINLTKAHKIIPLIDDRTQKPAFFCIACEFYSLRFRYDSVFNHIFSEMHTHNLSCLLQSDSFVPCDHDRTMSSLQFINKKFLEDQQITADPCLKCQICETKFEDIDSVLAHILDEDHLAELSDYLLEKARSQGDVDPEIWGRNAMNYDWQKFLAQTSKAFPIPKDHVVIENFIKPSSKNTNQCICCNMALKGPRQVLFNHIRQKRHIKNAAPFKLSSLYKNFCRPVEYFASFGNYYICLICPGNEVFPSFSSVVDHFDCDEHVKSISDLVKSAFADNPVLVQHQILNQTCVLCEKTFENNKQAVEHVLIDLEHQNKICQTKVKNNKIDVISCYMKGNYILHEGSTFNCVICNKMFNSLRSILFHLVYADHFEGSYKNKNLETVFRFYLELKHNVNLFLRNKYVYYDFGKLKCGVCNEDVNDTAKKHCTSAGHKENMGANYVNMDASADGERE